MLSFLASVSGQNDILINASEHDAVYQNFLTLQRFNYKIKIINNNSLGQVTPPILAKKLSEKTKFVAVMLLNNETGAINNIAALAKIIDSYASEHSIAPIHLHVDATQALGKINFDINKLNCDSAVFSAHKVGGPRGSGLLYQRKARPSLLSGGGQEFGLRSGTENIFAIAGMVLALEKNYHCINNNGQVMHYFMQQLSKLGAIILPGERLENNEQFCPYIVNCAFMPLPGEVMVRVLSKVGVYISTGSACASNKKKSLRSFNAMGLNANVSSCAVRFSFNPAVSLPFMQGLINRLTKALKDLAYQAVL
jgi:cysteine desulfurase